MFKNIYKIDILTDKFTALNWNYEESYKLISKG